jgi:hypothetical protein
MQLEHAILASIVGMGIPTCGDIANFFSIMPRACSVRM